MGITIDTTYSAKLAPLEHPPVSQITVVSQHEHVRRPDTAALAVNRMREAAEMVAWINENIPATRISHETDGRSEMTIIATFAGEADATASKTLWG